MIEIETAGLFADGMEETVTYTPAAGSAQDLEIIRDGYDPDLMDDTAPGDEMVIWVRDSISFAKGDVFVIDSETWYLLEKGEKLAGVISLSLTKSSRRRI